ncbi:hypothetical protein T492DRAFT_932552 [Pavlovales sp. CCMP2436]|nr:hypothetical protein T492DRAFT_932552 [Pavlovales sp. CCMP2436]
MSKMGGGKNTSWIDEYADFFAPTAGEAVEKRDAFIYKYMHTPVKLPKRNAVVSEGEPPAVRSKRAAAPTVRTPGLMPGAGHAGPGRGRTFEPTKLPEPSVRPTTGNWFEQRQWGAKRIAELERQCYTGIPTELTITREALPVTSLSRVTRSALDAESITRGQGAAVGSVVCVETHNSEQTTPWVIGEVVSAAHTAPADSVPYDSANDAVHYEPVRVGESVLSVMLYEPLAPGSTTYSLSDVELLVPARRVRVVGVQLLALRSNHFKRFAIEAVSLQAIRAEMPTSDDTWTVEAVVQYRTYYRQERWLVKWVGYGEDPNTWEPIENFTAEWVQGEAERVKKDFLAEKAAKECAAARGGPRRAAAQ